jgi:hypothetical protein
VNQEASSTPTPPGPSAAPDFKQVSKYLTDISERERLGEFNNAGWTPAELGEFARAVYLAPGKSHPTAASYQYAMEKGVDHPFAVETLASLRAPGFTMPPFSRPVPKEFAWDDPDNPAHTAELRADVEEIARLWRMRAASWHDQPWPVEAQPIPKALWRKLFKLRNRYHSLADTLQSEELTEQIQIDVSTIAYCLRRRSACLHGFEQLDANMPIPKALWKNCFKRRARYSSLEEALEHEGLVEYR